MGIQSTTFSLTRPSKLTKPKYCTFLHSCFYLLQSHIAKISKVYIMGIREYASLIVLIGFISLGNAAVINVKADTSPTVPETSPTVPETSPTVPETSPTLPETSPTDPTAPTTPTVPETSPTDPTAP